MSENTNEKMNEAEGEEEKKESIGGYIGNLILSMLFPFMALWYGPKYLINGEYVKGIVLILIVAVELAIVWSNY
ncbi:MAG: hypothetical protein DRJ03_13915 [Chloroflexi bacterium]|nr:MAG: hypothetical protein B6I35_14150 [Anaerolineaceae bacterium 4572_32.2]RLC77086.1 MAG: hypothetical protein DRI81_09125 [Chloroflexota bacterium]RLC84572.1 MAG: hypothetical protein DRJ03_13915 [Chloroflexota bacterium]HEY73687.1 hypothetical protein [Thermoflexia bacterium]